MRYPTEPTETERKSFVEAALQEAARYEPDTSAPHDLVAGALARHERSGKRCGPSRTAPTLLASAFGMALLLGGGLWLLRSHRISGARTLSEPSTAFHSGPKTVSPVSAALPPLEFAHSLLPPIDTTRFLASAGRSPDRHRTAHYKVRYHHRSALVRNSLPTVPENRSVGVWTTETVHREIVAQTLTPVWVAQTDPETRTIVLTPALYQLSLQPDEDADATTAQVGAAFIPVRYEQEKTQP